MPILTPNSFGTIWSRRVREHNPYHEPAGSPKGGQFAHRPGGAAPAKKVGDSVIREWSGDVVKQVFGRDLSPTGLQQLAEDMVADTEGLTFSLKASARLYQTDSLKMKPTVILTWVGNDGNPNAENPEEHPTNFVRAFYRDDRGNLVVKHSSFEKNRAQPAGLGKDVLRSHVRTYERLGVDRIETYANIDVGAYAWAKYGFAAWNTEQVRTMVEEVVAGAEGMTIFNKDFQTGASRGRGVGIGEREAAMLRRIVASNNKTAIWEFADATLDGVKVGKELLAMSDGWDAYFKVKDDGSPLTKRMHERFWSYVGRTKATKKREAVARAPRGIEPLIYTLDYQKRARTQPGEMCEWQRDRYGDRRLWNTLLDGDIRPMLYDLRSPSHRAAYRAQLPKD